MGRFSALATLKDVKMLGGRCDSGEHVEMHLPFQADVEVDAANGMLTDGTPWLGEEMELLLVGGHGSFRRCIGWGTMKRLSMAATEDASARVALELSIVAEIGEIQNLFSDLLPMRGQVLEITGKPRQLSIPGTETSAGAAC